MNGACWRTLRRPATAGSLSAAGWKSAASPADAFFARFYAVVTRHSIGRSYPDLNLTQCPRQRFPRQHSAREIHATTRVLAARKGPPKKPARPKKTPSQEQPSEPLGSIPPKALNAIFGKDMNPTAGRRILQTLHDRRVTGSIIEHGVVIENNSLPMETLLRGLKWLRDKYPVDEQAAATYWAEKEALKLQESYISRAERLGLYKRAPTQEELEVEESEENEPQGTAYSVFEQMRKRNERKAEEEEKRRVESGEAQRSEELRLARVEEQRSKDEQRQHALEVRREKQIAAGMLSQNEEPPKMSRWKRLGPSTALAFVLTLGFSYYASTYQPPSLDTRLLPTLTPAWATTITIASICTTIFVLSRVPRMWWYYNKYMVAVPATPNPISILGNVFSHGTIRHLSLNMGFMFFYGLALHDMVGRGNFIALYCLGGVAGSMTSIYWFVLRGVLNTYSTGASGAVSAVAFAWAILNLNRDSSNDSQRDFAMDIARYMLLILQFASHFTPGITGYVDVASHIGGAVLGVLAASVLQYRAHKAQKAEGKYVS